VRYELLAGLRYTRAKRRNFFISISSLISMAGIGLGVLALIVVLSVMNGFQKELRTRILGVASHLQVTGPGNRLTNWKATAEAVKGHPRVLASAPFVNAQAMLSHGSAVRGAIVRGIIPAEEDKVADIGRHMKAGKLEALKAGEFNVVLGGDLARTLGALPGDRVALIAPQGLVTPAGLVPRLKQFTVAGIFEVGFNEADSALALVHIEDAQKLYQMEDQVSALRLKLDDLFAARSVGRELSAKLGQGYFAYDWTRSHANFFRAVEIEKRVMFIILAIIVLVAAFNTVSVLVMTVTEKRADIAILRTLGASPASVVQIFIVQGAVIGFIGTLLGVIFGVIVALHISTIVPAIESLFSIKFLSKEVYLIPDLPSDVHALDVVVVALMSLFLSFVAAVLPSFLAARVNPAEALRYE
jgi:lipoprotein-releasing system permease protein